MICTTSVSRVKCLCKICVRVDYSMNTATIARPRELRNRKNDRAPVCSRCRRTKTIERVEVYDFPVPYLENQWICIPCIPVREEQTPTAQDRQYDSDIPQLFIRLLTALIFLAVASFG